MVVMWLSLGLIMTVSCFHSPWLFPVSTHHDCFLFPLTLAASCFHSPWLFPVSTHSDCFLWSVFILSGPIPYALYGCLIQIPLVTLHLSILEYTGIYKILLEYTMCQRGAGYQLMWLQIIKTKILSLCIIPITVCHHHHCVSSPSLCPPHHYVSSPSLCV